MEEKEKDTSQPEEQTAFVNPIDADKIAENPHLLPYAHTRGGVKIKAVDKGKIKGRAVSAMYEQTDLHLDQIKEQIELLARQARDIQARVSISEEIYQAEINFEPLIGRMYYLYRRPNGKPVLSLVAPVEWGPKPPYDWVASVYLMADHTWEIKERGERGESL